MNNSEIQLVILAAIYGTIATIAAVYYIKKRKGAGANNSIHR